MCVVSMVGDHYNDKWQYLRSYTFPRPNTITVTSENVFNDFSEIVSKQQFDELKKEVEELKKLLKRAKEYDEKNNEPNCEIEDKMKFLKAVAKLVGIDLDDVLKSK